MYFTALESSCALAEEKSPHKDFDKSNEMNKDFQPSYIFQKKPRVSNDLQAIAPFAP